MSATVDTITLPCQRCGQGVIREIATGIFAAKINALPGWCDECAAMDAEQINAELSERTLRQQKIQRRDRLAHSGLPRTLRAVDLDRLDPAGVEEAIAAGKAWARRDVAGLLFTGPFGTGKSTIAAGALLLRLLDGAGRWVSAPELMAKLGKGFGDLEREWALDLLAARRALVIDDIDKTRPTEYGAEQIFLAVDNAVSRGQQLLVTTNLPLSQLAQKWPPPYGEAIASRLAGYCTAMHVGGRDRRLG